MNTELFGNRVVIKVGGDTLTRADGTLDLSVFASIAMQVAVLNWRGKQVAIVTSAGIKAGVQTLNSLGIESAHFSKKLLAGIGAQLLLSTWANAFKKFRTAQAQFWVTHGNWDKEGEREIIKSGLSEALSANVVPIINENDVVSDAEIRLMEKGWGENDNMAARVAELIQASSVLFLSSVGAIFEANPHENIQARKYEMIDAWNIPEALRCPNGTSTHGEGKNGINNIRTKVEAAAFCHRHGMRVNISGLSVDESDTIIFFGSNKQDQGTAMGNQNVLK